MDSNNNLFSYNMLFILFNVPCSWFIPVGITYATWSGLGIAGYNNYWDF